MTIINFLLASALALLAFLQGQAQTFHPMLRSDVQWEVSHVFPSAGSVSFSYSWLSIDPANDTVINGHQYRFLQGSLLREDSMTRKVYRYDAQHDSDMVLYDWNLQLGDSVPTTLLNDNWEPDSSWQVVQHMHTIMVEGTERKVWRFAPTQDFTLCHLEWYEGIGSATGPARIFDYDCWHGNNEFTCYRYISSAISDPLWGYFCSPVGLGEVQKAATLVAYPNPASSQLHLKTNGSIGNVRIFNVTGKQVLNQQNLFWQSEQTLNIATLPPGMYLLIAKTPEGAVHKKISIIH